MNGIFEEPFKPPPFLKLGKNTPSIIMKYYYRLSDIQHNQVESGVLANVKVHQIASPKSIALGTYVGRLNVMPNALKEGESIVEEIESDNAPYTSLVVPTKERAVKLCLTRAQARERIKQIKSGGWDAQVKLAQEKGFLLSGDSTTDDTDVLLSETADAGGE